ncbi:hypothetical protein BKA62DRAFT_765954 [Auriculariales sp. MPI-PUGE-AT-0066]|nr:hypothetical protein BKA62DRAFT_765954 [Auriculariales sp. MPI-PUGE-AT-0066]
MRLTTSLSPLLLAAAGARAQVASYPLPVVLPTPGYTYSGWEAYDFNQHMTPPPLPTPAPTLDFPIALDYGGNPDGTVTGIEVAGSFLGVSIEMSLAEVLIGPNASWVWPQFLNLMSNLKERGGPPVLRLGGNSQEKAALVPELEKGHSIKRQVIGPSSFTNTPTVLFTKGIMEAMKVASDLIGIHWFMGAPMNQTQPARLEIIEATEPILGDYLLTWHIGNEPDLYNNHGYRVNYTEEAYILEYTQIRDAIQADPNIQGKNKMGGPAICECNTGWSNIDLVNNQHYLDLFGSNLNALIVMHYPTDNCPTLNPDGSWTHIEGQVLIDKTQGLFNNYARHNLRTPTYLPMAAAAQGAGKPLVLLETNTASCNGYLGLSDAFLATLWNLDLAMQLASYGFSHMMIHLGGHQAYYNPFMSPPWNSSAPFMWTVGPPFYSILVASEFIGPNGNTRVGDLKINGDNSYMAGYVVYENNQPVRVLLINFMDDPSGAHDYTARIQTNGVAQAKFNITYANQTFGGYFESDGVLRGTQFTDQIPCQGNICSVKVKAPGATVVFLTSDTIFDANTDKIETFATTATTKMYNTAAVDGLTLATTNGLNGQARLKMVNAQTSNPQKNTNKNDATSNRISTAIATIGMFVTGLVALL